MPGPASNGILLKTIGTDGDDMIDFRNDTIPTYHTAYGDAELFDGDFKPGVIFTGGNDIIYGLNDLLVGTSAQLNRTDRGNDTIYGGDGFDAIWGDIVGGPNARHQLIIGQSTSPEIDTPGAATTRWR